jgi:hypothetical protein
VPPNSKSGNVCKWMNEMLREGLKVLGEELKNFISIKTLIQKSTKKSANIYI